MVEINLGKEHNHLPWTILALSALGEPAALMFTISCFPSAGVAVPGMAGYAVIRTIELSAAMGP